MNDLPYDGNPPDHLVNVHIDHERVMSMAGDSEDAADAVDSTEQTVRDKSQPAESGLQGWETAGQINKAMVAWSLKASACRDSLEYFAEALRATAAAIEEQDEENAAAFVFPSHSPMTADEPPWVRPVEHPGE